MPHITLHGISLDLAKRVSAPLLDDLAALTGTPRDHFSIRVNRDTFVFDGVEVEPDPFVEIGLFERDSAIEDAMAAKVTEHLRSAGITSVEVYLNHFARRRYFENGSHF